MSESRPCPYCTVLIRADASFCTGCGQRTPPAAPPPPAVDVHELVRQDQNRLWYAILFYFLILGSFIAIGFTMDGVAALFASAVALAVLCFAAVSMNPRDVIPAFARRGFGWLGYGAVAFGCIATFLLGTVVVEALRLVFSASAERYMDPIVGAGWSWIWVVILIAVEPAIFEELAFRGVLWSSLERLMKPRDVVWVTALTFAILHLNLLMMPFLTILGIYLGWLRLRSKSLYPSMIAHFGHNFLVIAAERWVT